VDPQEYTNRRLVELAEDRTDVVRLQGGDPTVFGRGGEEMAHLAENGSPSKSCRASPAPSPARKSPGSR